MTIYCLRKGYVPWTLAGFDALFRLNLYITFALGLFDFGPIGRRYLQTHSLSYSVLGRHSRLRLSWYNCLRNAWRAQDLQMRNSAVAAGEVTDKRAVAAGEV